MERGERSPRRAQKFFKTALLELQKTFAVKALPHLHFRTKNFVFYFIYQGNDTTASVNTFAILMLASHPEIQVSSFSWYFKNNHCKLFFILGKGLQRIVRDLWS